MSKRNKTPAPRKTASGVGVSCSAASDASSNISSGDAKQLPYLSTDVGITPDAAFLAAIALRLKSELAAGCGPDSPEVRRSISGAAQTLARDIYVTAYEIVAKTSRADLPKIGLELEAQAAVTGCRFATLIRQSVYPNKSNDGPITDIERFAAQAYWISLINFIDVAGVGGRA